MTSLKQQHQDLDQDDSTAPVMAALCQGHLGRLVCENLVQIKFGKRLASASGCGEYDRFNGRR